MSKKDIFQTLKDCTFFKLNLPLARVQALVGGIQASGQLPVGDVSATLRWVSAGAAASVASAPVGAIRQSSISALRRSR
jgi:hypothetical protein